MRESRRTYFLSSLNLNQINFIFNLLVERLDELEGRRGTPSFLSNVDMNTNKIINLGMAIIDTDGLRKGQMDFALAGYQKMSEKNQANGYCGLDAATLISDARIPSNIQRKSEKGQANGYASLEADIKITTTQLRNPIWIGTVAPNPVEYPFWLDTN